MIIMRSFSRGIISNVPVRDLRLLPLLSSRALCLSGALPWNAPTAQPAGDPSQQEHWHRAFPCRRKTKATPSAKGEHNFPWIKHSYNLHASERYQYSKFRVSPQKRVLLVLEHSRALNNPGYYAKTFVWTFLWGKDSKLLGGFQRICGPKRTF